MRVLTKFFASLLFSLWLSSSLTESFKNAIKIGAKNPLHHKPTGISGHSKLYMVKPFKTPFKALEWMKKLTSFFKSRKAEKKDFDTPDKYGNTPLMYAIASNNETEYKELVEKHKCNVDAQNNDKQSALMIAAANGNLNAAVYLAENDANLDLQDKYGRSATMLASGNDHKKIVEYLITNANLDLKDNDKNNALQIAIICNAKEVAEFLAKNGADTNNKNKLGDNSLHLCAKNKNFTEIAKLIANSENINEENKLGSKPLDLATQLNIELARVLKGRDAEFTNPMPNKYKLLIFSGAIFFLVFDEGWKFRQAIMDVTKNGYTTPEGQQKIQKFALFFARKAIIAIAAGVLAWVSDSQKNTFRKLGFSSKKDDKAKIGPIKLQGNSFESNEDTKDTTYINNDDSREFSGDESGDS